MYSRALGGDPAFGLRSGRFQRVLLRGLGRLHDALRQASLVSSLVAVVSTLFLFLSKIKRVGFSNECRALSGHPNAVIADLNELRDESVRCLSFLFFFASIGWCFTPSDRRVHFFSDATVDRSPRIRGQNAARKRGDRHFYARKVATFFRKNGFSKTKRKERLN